MRRQWTRQKLVSRLLDDSREAQIKLGRWRTRTSSHEVVNLLMDVLRSYPLRGRARTLLIALFVGFNTIALFLLSCFIANTAFETPWLLVAILLPLLPISAVLIESNRRFRITREAALMLASMNDERAIPYLAESWREKTSEEMANESVANELTRLATRACRPGEKVLDAPLLRNFIIRRFPLSSRRDLTDAEADMFLSVLRLLALSDAPEDRSLLRKISRLKTLAPNHALIVEAARQMVEPPALSALSPEPLAYPEITAQPQQLVQQQQRF